MAVISLRLNKNEEGIVNFLTNYYEQDKTSLIKHSLQEMYEDLIDKDIIKNYEKKQDKGNARFVSGDEIMKMLKA